MEILNTILNNVDTFFIVVGAIVTVASTFVGLTSSTKDDEILGKIIKVIEYLSIFNKKTK
jgi:hypothetical protein